MCQQKQQQFRFISPLLVNLKLSNSRQEKYSVIVWKTVHRNTDWVNLWTCERSVTKRCCYVSVCFFKWVYANPWPSLVGVRRMLAYHVDYTTEPIPLLCVVRRYLYHSLTCTSPKFSVRSKQDILPSKGHFGVKAIMAAILKGRSKPKYSKLATSKGPSEWRLSKYTTDGHFLCMIMMPPCGQGIMMQKGTSGNRSLVL